MGPILCDEDRATLVSWTRKGSGELRKARRAGIVLALADGKKIAQVCRETGHDGNTVRLWRDRFLEGGVLGLERDSPRPGRPKTITAQAVQSVLTLTRMATPEDATHWSVRSMADVVQVSPASIQRIWS